MLLLTEWRLGVDIMSFVCSRPSRDVWDVLKSQCNSSMVAESGSCGTTPLIFCSKIYKSSRWYERLAYALKEEKFAISRFFAEFSSCQILYTMTWFSTKSKLGSCLCNIDTDLKASKANKVFSCINHSRNFPPAIFSEKVKIREI